MVVVRHVRVSTWYMGNLMFALLTGVLQAQSFLTASRTYETEIHHSNNHLDLVSA